MWHICWVVCAGRVNGEGQVEQIWVVGAGRVNEGGHVAYIYGFWLNKGLIGGTGGTGMGCICRKGL